MKAALQKIKIYTGFIELLDKIHNGQENNILTEYGPSPNYNVEDGLDQGETFSPILWRIFYDPLLCEIKENNKSDGYILHNKWIADIADKGEKISAMSINHLAFVDDTCWIAKSEKSAQNILRTANSFFDTVNIEINFDKTEIIRISPKNSIPKTKLKLDNDNEINILQPTQSARYLGVWIRADGKADTVINMINKELNSICFMLARKQITDKQAAYIFNNVIAPAIEYRTMITFINKTWYK